MRHLKRGRKLNRNPSHRKAMVRNLVTSLFVHGRVITTPAKAKEARPFAEKLITLAKKGGLPNRRRAVSLLHDEGVVKDLFAEIAPRYKERPGGFCRILHLAKTRVGDSAPQVIFELVEEEMEGKAAAAPAAAAVAAPAAETAEAEKTEEPAAEEAGTEETAPAEESAAEEEKAEESAEEPKKEE